MNNLTIGILTHQDEISKTYIYNLSMFKCIDVFLEELKKVSGINTLEFKEKFLTIEVQNVS